MSAATMARRAALLRQGASIGAAVYAHFLFFISAIKRGFVTAGNQAEGINPGSCYAVTEGSGFAQ